LHIPCKVLEWLYTRQIRGEIMNSIKEHIGHDVEVVTYGNGHNGNASIECNDCYEVLACEEE
jgi:hypothetical protein